MIARMPRVQVDLMYEAAKDNDPFYQGMVKDFYASTQKRHRKFPLVRVDEYGVALATLPASFEDYFMTIEASARRNYKKAKRSGCSFERIDFNAHLDEIADIWQSAGTRQGPVPSHMAGGRVRPCTNPPSLTRIHDYPYFGVLRGGRLIAYAGCLLSGELCAIEQILGHARHQADGVVPMLIVDMAGCLIAEYPQVKVCTYDTFLGASVNLRRFKRKFTFRPCKVTWVLG